MTEFNISNTEDEEVQASLSFFESMKYEHTVMFLYEI